MTYEKTKKRKKLKVLGIKISKAISKRSKEFIQMKHLNIIRNSPLFDIDWYFRYYKGYKISNPLDLDYLTKGTQGDRNPGPYFYSNEYLLMYPDVEKHHLNPLVHYEMWGYKERRNISLADKEIINFPAGTKNINKEIKTRNNFDKKKVVVFAAFSSNGKISEKQLYLLKGLKEISDYIIFVSDNPIFEEETEKIKDYCNYCIFIRHEEYDFGSYKRGYQFLQENNILQENDDLIFVNDSCYGPVYPLSEVIMDFEKKKSKKKCDFYGLSLGLYPQEYIQSFFYIFSHKVFSSNIFSEFIGAVKKELSSGCVIYKYEMQFTKKLREAGFKFSSLVSKKSFKLDINKHSLMPTKYTLSLLKKYRYPFVKVKVLQGSSVEKPQEIIDFVEKENNELFQIIKPDIEKKLQSIKHKRVKKVSKYALYKEYNQKILNIKNKVKIGEKIKVVFLINMTSMFPAESLMQKFMQDSLFDVKLYVIPDIRFGEEELIDMLKVTYEALKQKYDCTKLSVEINKDNEISKYYDVVKDADLVCYPSPYDISFSLYNPYYAAQQGILSLHINYGFFRSIYDRFIYQLDNYNNFWKVIIETDLNMEEYSKYGQCKGTNALVVGYSKMDKMAEIFNNKKENLRKKIIIAPHHSIKGGMNKTLSLSNFIKLADFFLDLPEKYPQIDFIFRPHPVLFKVLSRENMWGKEKVEKYLKEMLSHTNVIYSTEGNYLDIFAQSDGIIQDCGSFLVEYFYTKKPQCYILKKETDIEKKFSELGKKCLEHCYISYTEEDIINYIEDVILNENDYKKAKRVEFAENEIMKNYPHVTDKILEELKKELLGE